MTQAIAINLGGAPALPSSPVAAFHSIPAGHGVAILGGEVVVYDEQSLGIDGLQAGAFYVVEYQRPHERMSWQLHQQHDCQRVEARREVIRAEPSRQLPDHWAMRHASGSSSGPICENNLAEMILGRVVGIYRPKQ